MPRISFGKIHPVLACVLVVATLAASAGAGILYQHFNGNKLPMLDDSAEKEEAQNSGNGAPRPGNSGGGSSAVPPPPPANNPRPERTKPFKYVFSDRAHSTSESKAADPNPTYSTTILSAEDFNQGNRDFLLQAIDHYRSANVDKDAKVVEQTATLLADIVNAGPDGDLKQFHEQISPLLQDPAVASDPFFQYLAGTVLVQNDEIAMAKLLFNGSIADHQKWDYPSRYVVVAFNERLRNGMDLKTNRDGYESHIDAIVGWLQYDFSAKPDEECFCWPILNDSIELLAKNEKLDYVKKIIDKNSDNNFISPWLAEMMLAHYYLNLASADEGAQENLNKSKQHLQAAIKINPAFTVAKTDLEAVDGRLAGLQAK